ncbi:MULTISPECIES: hypothetical protein [unclassified Okeania]
MVTVFEVFDTEPPECLEGKKITKHLFEKAIIFYYQENLVKLLNYFKIV